MDTKFNRPKGFGEILDLTFSLSKSRFRDFFTIALIFMGPIYLLQSLILLASGKSFFREVGVGEAWFDQLISGFTDTEATSLGADLGVVSLGFISLFLFPVASAAILLAVNHIRKNETYTIGSVIKKAFSRYGPIIGGTILFTIITIILVVVPLVASFMITGIALAVAPSVSGVIFAILLFLGLAVGIGYLLTRWSFYFGSVVLGDEVPGLSRSWRLTQKRTWTLLGLYIIFILLIIVISFAVELTFGLFLGNSVLLSMITSLVTIVTTVIFAVGYAVMYLDLKVRHDADDIKELIQDYNVKP